MRTSSPVIIPCAAWAIVSGLMLGTVVQAQSVPAAQSATQPNAPVKSLGVVTVSSGQPTSLPTQIPTTIEGVTREQIDNTVTAFDSEDALKYFPSLLVRKRYIGDYNHAMLSSRASGTSNSPRSMVYADGMALSNLLGSGVSTLTYAPRWNMVNPEEIERVDVMYGPFSAAYPGNSVGAVVDYVTRMPQAFEATVKLANNLQPFQMYNTSDNFGATQGGFTLGNKAGDWSWFLAADRTDSNGQPLTFGTLTKGNTAATTQAVVSGAVPDRNTSNAPIYVVGTGTQYHAIQDHSKLKLAYDITSTLQATYQLGLWQNTSQNRPVSYLKDASGQTVYTGDVSIDGKKYTLPSFGMSNESLLHAMHGVSLKTHTQSAWDWELLASLYDYVKDEKRANSATSSGALPGAVAGGAGTLADGRGSGWNTLAAKATWRPEGIQGAHIVDMGVQQDSGQLKYQVSNITNNWITDGADALASQIAGKTRLQSAYAQDTWAFAPRWKTVLGLRAEQWSALDASTTYSNNSQTQNYERREEFYLSPKLALAHQYLPDTTFKASLGRAVRMPTLSELYGATTTATSQYINDPNLKAEKSWTGEFSVEKATDKGLLRLTVFAEETKDSIYSQYTTAPDNTTVSRVGNVDRILTKGAEVVYNGTDVLTRGLDLWASLTFADSKIVDNAGYVTNAGDTIGKMQPNIPVWRASVLADYKVDAQWQVAGAIRYSGPQFRTLNNADVNGYTYMGVSEYLTADVRVRYRVDRHWVASFGIDNLNNYQYWNFHPYPQRNYTAELKWTY